LTDIVKFIVSDIVIDTVFESELFFDIVFMTEIVIVMVNFVVIVNDVVIEIVIESELVPDSDILKKLLFVTWLCHCQCHWLWYLNC